MRTKERSLILYKLLPRWTRNRHLYGLGHTCVCSNLDWHNRHSPSPERQKRAGFLFFKCFCLTRSISLDQLECFDYSAGRLCLSIVILTSLYRGYTANAGWRSVGLIAACLERSFFGCVMPGE